MNKRDMIIIFSFYSLTLLPLFLKLFRFGEENYLIIVFLAGFIPIYATHTTSLGLSFKNIYFLVLWCTMILLNWALYNSIVSIWLSMTISFGIYNLLRLMFIRINKEDPIPIFVGLGTSLEYNKKENRKENKRDGLFTALSFFLGLTLSVIGLIMTK